MECVDSRYFRDMSNVQLSTFNESIQDNFFFAETDFKINLKNHRRSFNVISLFR